MSGKRVQGEPAMDSTVTSSDGSFSDTEYSHIEAETSESESLEISGDEPHLRKESGELFGGNESDTKKTDSETSIPKYLEATGTDCSFEQRSVEDVFDDEDKQDESNYASNEDDVTDSSETSLSLNADVETNSVEEKFVGGIFERESKQSITEKEFKSLGKADSKLLKRALKSDSDAPSSLKKYDTSLSVESEYDETALKIGSVASNSLHKSDTSVSDESEHDETALKIDNDEPDSLKKSNASLSDESEYDETALKIDSDASNSLKKSDASLSDESEHEETGKEFAKSKSPQLPTKALKALSISDSPNSSAKKNTPRQSRSRPRAINNIFDSPYNTRLKARMIREREMRSRSVGNSFDE